jgi:hypothetical protein
MKTTIVVMVLLTGCATARPSMGRPGCTMAFVHFPETSTTCVYSHGCQETPDVEECKPDSSFETDLGLGLKSETPDFLRSF